MAILGAKNRQCQFTQENLYQCYSREEEWYEMYGFEVRTNEFKSYIFTEPALQASYFIRASKFQFRH